MPNDASSFDHEYEPQTVSTYMKPESDQAPPKTKSDALLERKRAKRYARAIKNHGYANPITRRNLS